MVSKNNFKNKMNADAKRVPHYGLRKLGVGVASVLLGTTLYLGAGSVAHASVPASTTTPTTTETTTPSTPTSNASNEQTVTMPVTNPSTPVNPGELSQSEVRDPTDTLQFIDANGTQVGTQTVNGDTGDNVTPTLPNGWTYNETEMWNRYHGSLKFGTANQTLQIPVVHGFTTLNQDQSLNPGEIIPGTTTHMGNGATRADLNAESQRVTVFYFPASYNVADASSTLGTTGVTLDSARHTATVTQIQNLTRWAIVDTVTGNVEYYVGPNNVSNGNGQSSVWNGATQFDAINIPEIAGYSAHIQVEPVTTGVTTDGRSLTTQNVVVTYTALPAGATTHHQTVPAGNTAAPTGVAPQAPDANNGNMEAGSIYTFTYQYVDPSNTVVGTQTFTGSDGTTVDTANLHVPAGYLLATTSWPTTHTFNGTDQTYTIHVVVPSYGPNTPTTPTHHHEVGPNNTDTNMPSLLLIRYQLADGTLISEDSVSGNAGQTKTLAFNLPAGYHLVAGETLPSTSYTFSGHDVPLVITVEKNATQPDSGNVQPVQPSNPNSGNVQPAQPSNPNSGSAQPAQPSTPQQNTANQSNAAANIAHNTAMANNSANAAEVTGVNAAHQAILAAQQAQTAATAKTANANQQSAKTLPQTGNDSKAALGLAAAGFAAMLGAGFTGRRKED